MIRSRLCLIDQAIGPSGESMGQTRGAASVRVADYFSGEAFGECSVSDPMSQSAFVAARDAARAAAAANLDQRVIDERFGGDRALWQATIERAHQRNRA